MPNIRLLITYACFYLITLSGISIANADENQRILDSLIQQLEILPEGEDRMKTLTRIGQRLVHNDPQQTILYMQESAKLGEKFKDTLRWGGSYMIMGTAWKNQGEYVPALENLLKAQELFESAKMGVFLEKSQNIIGNIHSYQRNYKQALTYHTRALEGAEKRKDSSMIATYLQNVAGDMYKLDQDSLALIYFYACIPFLEKTGRKYELGTLLSNLALLYSDKKNEVKAYNLTLKARDLHEEIGNIQGVLYAEMGLAQYARYMKKYEISFKHYQTSFRLADSLNSQLHLSELYFEMGQYYNNIGQPDSAFNQMMKYVSLNKELLNEKYTEQTAEMEVKYETEKKEKELIQQQLLIAENRQHTRNLWLIFLGIISVLLFGVGYYYLRNRYQQRVKMEQLLTSQQRARFGAMIQAEEKERKRIARELHDGLGQLLATARMHVSSLDDAIEGSDDEDKAVFGTSLSLIDEACQEVRHISHNMMPGSLMEAGLVPAVRDMVAKINAVSPVSIKLEIPEFLGRLEENKEVALYRIIQEVINNMLKHSEATEVEMKLTYNAPNLRLSLKDNGKGVSKEKLNQGDGIGWDNIQSRTEMLEGQLEIESQPGIGTHIAINCVI